MKVPNVLALALLGGPGVDTKHLVVSQALAEVAAEITGAEEDDLLRRCPALAVLVAEMRHIAFVEEVTSRVR